MKLKTGDIIFFRTSFKIYSPMSWLSTLIRVAASIKYNHVGIIIEMWGKLFVFEAVGRGIIATPLEDRIEGCTIKIVRPVRKIDKESYSRLACSQLGKRYDVIGLIWHQLVWNLFGFWVGKSAKKELKSLYCYEYAALLNSEDVEAWHQVKPKEFLNACWHVTIFES